MPEIQVIAGLSKETNCQHEGEKEQDHDYRQDMTSVSNDSCMGLQWEMLCSKEATGRPNNPEIYTGNLHVQYCQLEL